MDAETHTRGYYTQVHLFALVVPPRSDHGTDNLQIRSNAFNPVRRRPLTAVIAGAIVLALAGLVAVASHGTPVWTSLREGEANRSEILANVAVLGGVGLIAALAVTLIIHRALLANRPGAPPLRTTLLRALPIATIALAALALLRIARTPLVTEVADAGGVYVSCNPGDVCVGADARAPSEREDPLDRPDRDRRDRDDANGADEPQASAQPAEDGAPDSGDDDDGGGPDLSALWPILLIVLGAIAAAIVVRSRYTNRSAHREALHERDDRLPGPDQASARSAVARTIDAMLADPDPSTAIIGAYARLLEGLAACDAGRHDHEAPLEHLRRVLTTLHVRPEPLHRLIDLFEVARFSTHPLTESHRDQALDALQAAAADLAVVPLPPVTAGAAPIKALR